MAPHTSQTRFFFLGGYFGSLARAGWALRTRHKLAFSFWAGTLVLWLGRTGRSAHVTNLLFLFGRVLLLSDICLVGAPHTSQTCFFFLGGYFCSLTFACWALRTRHKLAFSFGRVLLLSDICLVGAPHTSQTCFFFLGGYYRFSGHAFPPNFLSGMTHLAKTRLRTRISRITAPSSPRKNRARRSAPNSVPSFPNSPLFPNSPNPHFPPYPLNPLPLRRLLLPKFVSLLQFPLS